MKLVIQIPCFNEENTLPSVLEGLPKNIEGISQIEVQIIDDCSTDATAELARELGVTRVVSITGRNRKWLGRAFKLGVRQALKNGADILVNTDGDNQYPGERIPDLVKPIIEKRADLVIGDRAPHKSEEFSYIKRKLQKLGNLVVGFLVREPVPDAVSGFRAYSRKALLRIHVVTKFTYTVDTLIQAYKKGLAIEWLPIKANPKTRESRLITNIWSKVAKSGLNILRMSAIYSPFLVFLSAGLIFLIPGLFFVIRFLFFYFTGEGSGHIQSLVLGGVSIVVAVQMFMLGVLAELFSVNRQLLEETLTKLKNLEK